MNLIMIEREFFVNEKFIKSPLCLSADQCADILLEEQMDRFSSLQSSFGEQERRAKELELQLSGILSKPLKKKSLLPTPNSSTRKLRPSVV